MTLVRRLTLLLALLAALALAPNALADVVTRQDADGRTFTIDVRVENADVDWYAENDITLHLGKKIAQIDRVKRRVIAEDGTIAEYDRVLLATGSNGKVLVGAYIIAMGAMLFDCRNQLTESYYRRRGRN